MSQMLLTFLAYLNIPHLYVYIIGMWPPVLLFHCPSFFQTRRPDVPWTLHSIGVTLHTDWHTAHLQLCEHLPTVWSDLSHTGKAASTSEGCDGGGGDLVREPVLTSVSVLTSPYALNSSLATHTNHAASWQLNLLEMTGHVSTSSGTVLKKYNTATHTDPCTRTYKQFVFFGQFQEQLVRPCHQG